jgi:hypothetical protein
MIDGLVRRNDCHGKHCDLNHLDWTAFQGEAKQVPFDPQRYINWRFYWDYSGGNVTRTAITCQMAIASYRRGTTVRWDPGTEEIV